ncbi:MAG: KEOPS complex subunit Pcc1 [Candidatus Nanoarchaeia archaeon]|nr:KEOPS complex subunit Pcc1 [Candidatus Nanoarchaeia archaeon]
MKFSIGTIIEFENKGEAERYYQCLYPEISDIKKGKAKIRLDKEKLKIEIKAEEITTAKALISSQLRLIEAVKKTEKMIE